MWGGVLGLPLVTEDCWGGLPITLILATFGLAFAFPLAILVALGRRSTKLPAVKMLCVLYVELIRGVPLISAAVHGQRDVPAVHAGGRQHRQAAARADRHHPVRRRLSGRGRARRPAGAAEGPVRGGRRARPQLLAEDRLHHPAAGAAAGDPAAGQHLHRLLQGHLAGADHRHVRPADHGQDRAQRPALAELLHRGLSRRSAVIYIAFCFAMSKYSRGLERELSRARRR